ncbi:hypothetical protein [uncultured Eubacterium sp.]|nr:hypothetical protein [uncultured Eubacterium sp.]
MSIDLLFNQISSGGNSIIPSKDRVGATVGTVSVSNQKLYMLV